MMGPCLTCTTALWNVGYSHYCMCWGAPSWGDIRCKHRKGPLFLADMQSHDQGCSLCYAFSLLPARAWASELFSLALIFLRYSRLAGWQENMASPDAVCSWNMGFTGSGETGRHNWVEKLNGRKLQQAKEKKSTKKNWNWLQKFERPQRTVDIFPYVQNSHRWSHESHRMKWRDERRQIMKLLLLAVSLTGRKGIIKLWSDNDYED